MASEAYSPFSAGIPGSEKPNANIFNPYAIRSLTSNGGTGAAATNHDAAAGTYNFTGGKTLNIFVSVDNGATYKKLTQAFVAADFATPAAATALEIATKLMANPLFAKYFTFSNNAGTLRAVAKWFSSRFKFYCTGDAATALAGVYTTAIASGSAVGGSAQAGALLEVIAEDFFGNPVPFAKIFATSYKSGAVDNSGSFGGPTKGEQISNSSHEAVEFRADAEGKLSLYMVNSAAETVNATFEPGRAGSSAGTVLGTPFQTALRAQQTNVFA